MTQIMLFENKLNFYNEDMSIWPDMVELEEFLGEDKQECIMYKLFNDIPRYIGQADADLEEIGNILFNNP